MCGNFDGIASYAVGKGDNFKLAYENAIKVLRKNFIAFPLDHNMPITKKIVVNHNGTYLKVWPSYEGHMYGSPLYCAML